MENKIKGITIFLIMLSSLILITSLIILFSFNNNIPTQTNNLDNIWEDKFIENKTEHNFKSIWNSYDEEIKEYLIEWYDYYYVLYDNINSNFTLGEREYFLGKVTENLTRKCNSLKYYEKALYEFDDPNLIYEILYFVSLECEKDYKIYESLLLNSSSKSKQNIYHSLINEEKFQFEPYNIKKQEINIPEDFQTIIIGESYIEVNNNTIIGTQIERIIRDWASNTINVYPSQYEQIIPYGEGDNLLKAINGTSSTVIPLTSTIVIKSKGKWYAPDEKGIFRFEVLPDKVNYPTNKCYGNICLIIDTHGISSIVSQAIENNVSLVIACGDYIDKMAAAQYLAERGIDSFFPADRFIGNTINYQGTGILIGTAPIRNNVIGNQSIEFDKNELIVVQDNYESYPGQYYDSPKRYFEELEKIVPLHTTYITTSSNQTNLIIEQANLMNSKIIGVRIWTQYDYTSLRKWLLENSEHRAILFHSGLYPYAQKIFDEFPNQTSFGDPKPIFK
ncbi:MAG: hypothetical protein LAT82_01580 [Nanoarchaeota archaeon]|nr:hypothetical protein [Nanoarchaeota archaeon]